MRVCSMEWWWCCLDLERPDMVFFSGVRSMSTDPESRRDFGPFLQNVGPVCPVNGDERSIRYNNVEDLKAALEAHGKNVAAFLVEPIQGEAG